MPDRIRPPSSPNGVLLRIAAIILVAAPLLAAPPPAAATSTLAGADVTPVGGTTATTFVFTVVHASTEGRTPSTVRVTVAGSAHNMALIGGDPEAGLTYRYAGQLPAGQWTATFSATTQGPGPANVSFPDPITVTVAPTPTPGPTPPPTPTPRPTPTTAPPTATPRPTPRPTPLPPGVTPRPTPRPTQPPPGSTPAPTISPGATAEASAAGSTTPGASTEASAAETATAVASESQVATATGSGATPDPTAGGQIGLRMGFGQMGLVVLGGVTSIAGVIVLGRLWIQRRHRLTNGSGDGG